MTRPFVIITTRLPPAICGIGSYSAILRKHWPNEQTAVEFLVVGEAAGAGRVGDRDTITEFGEEPRRLRDALRRIGAADVLLHYAGRAYHRLGCPTWLPGVLAAWKREFPAGRLTVFFHELPGAMRITSPHFWLGRIDAHIIRRLAALAEVVATNTEHHVEELRRITRRSDVQWLPVGSNIEARTPETGGRADDEFVLFGLPFGRLQTLQLFSSYLRTWSAEGRLRKLHIIGPVDDKFSAEADALIGAWTNPAVVVRHGMLPPSAVSRLLSRARFALTNVTPETWSKSGAFMAAAAHGCAVVRCGAKSGAAPLCYTVTANEVATVSPEDVERKTTALAQWYHDNADWPVIAQRLAGSDRKS